MPVQSRRIEVVVRPVGNVHQQVADDGVVELRVHGVAGTPPEALLTDLAPLRVSGDRIAGFYRPRGYRQWTVGENLEYGQPGLAAVEIVQDWLASPAHRANVVSTRFRDAGIGIVSVPSAPGVFGGMPTTIVTLDVGFRRR